jgi:hypothetical protein
MKTKDKTTDVETEKASSDKAAAKWAALVNDRVIPMPRRRVPASLIKSEADLPENVSLMRDVDSPQDVPLGSAEVDLVQGNVFYTIECRSKIARSGTGRPKFALFVDDRPEVTINPNHTGRSVRQLFGLADDVLLFRDYESPNDEPVGAEDPATFEKGPVFVTRRSHTRLAITVNNRRFTEADGVKHIMTGRQIAALVSDNPDATEVFKLVSGRQPDSIPLDKRVHIKDCDVFRVIRSNVAGGFEPGRVKRELKLLKEGGCRVDFIDRPFPAVIYRGVPTRPNYPHIAATDVLVAVPGGYPAAFIDGAYLPQGSPLIGRVAGSPQHAIQAESRVWLLISYHPHNGGGGPVWNKDRHGFHTYFDEILCWIHRANG